MDIEDKLKRCPFCGEKANLVKVRSGLSFGKNFRYAPGCATDKCMGHWVTGKGFYSEAEAIEAWNRRADDSKDGES